MSVMRSIFVPLIGPISVPISGLRVYLKYLLGYNTTPVFGPALSFTRASSQYCPDNEGVVQQIPSGVPCFPGMRYTAGEWFNTEVDGVTPLTTSEGGILLEPGSTNKCTCYGVVPADEEQTPVVIDTPTTVGTGWVDNLDGTFTATASDGALSFAGKLFKGKVQNSIFTITSYGVGSVKVGDSSGANYYTERSADGTFEERIYVDSNSTFRFLATGFTGVISVVSLTETANAVGTKSFHDGSTFIQNIPGMTLSGDVAAVLSTVDDQTEIDAAGLGSATNSGKLYDCTTDVGGAAVIAFTGAMTAVATSFQQYVRVLSGSCVISDSAGVNTIAPSGSTYVLYKKENFTAVDARTVIITVAASSQVRFSGVDLEELPFSTSWKPSEGATATRFDTILSVTPPVYVSGIWHEQIYWTPRAVVAGRVETLLSQMSNATNGLGVISNGTTIYLEKLIAGVSEKATVTAVPVAGTQYILDAYMLADNTLVFKIDGVSDDVNTSTTGAVTLGTTLYIGSDGTTATVANMEWLTIDDRSV